MGVELASALGVALAGGTSVAQAFAVLAATPGPWTDGAAEVVRRSQAGEPVQQAIDRWAAVHPDPSVLLVADALALAAQTGASPAAAIGAVLATARDRRSLALEVRSASAQAQASAVVLVVTPVVFAALVAVADVRIRHVLVGSTLGAACVTVGAALDLAGAWWMARLVRAVR